jgi:hypothetical protein
MADLSSAYTDSAKKINGVKEAIGKYAKDFLPFIILIVNIVVTVCTKLFYTSLQNPFTADFFIELLTNLITTMFCYSYFVKYGENSEKLGCAAYKGNLERWGKMSGEVRSKSNDRFIDYCREQVEAERTERRHYYILNFTMISLKKYEEVYKLLSDEKIDQLVLNGELSKKEGKYIKKANADHNIKPINPILILCGVNTTHINDVGRNKMSHSTMAILSRPLSMFLLTAVVTMFNGTWHGVDKASVVFDMIYSVMMIILCSIMGFTSGTNAFHKDHDVIKGRIYFLERFLNEGKEETKIEQ